VAAEGFVRWHCELENAVAAHNKSQAAEPLFYIIIHIYKTNHNHIAHA